MLSQNELTQPIGFSNRVILIIEEGERLVTSLLKTTAQLIIKLFQFFTPAIAPAPTAGLFGVNIYLAMENQVTILWIRQAIAVTLALSLEGAGFLALKSAVRFYYLWRQGKKNTEYLYVALVISALYIAIGIGSTVMLENVSRDLRILGITAFLIAPLVYTASSLWDELDLAIVESKEAQRKAEANEQRQEAEEMASAAEAHQRQVEAEERSFHQQMALEQQRHQQAVELQQIAANAELARVKAELDAQIAAQKLEANQAGLPADQSISPATNKIYICEGCHRTFGNHRALNGHKRSCPAWHEFKHNGHLNQVNV
jgi:hypothetical protein